MLVDADDVVLEQAGAGIGHVQGVTGRDAGEVGPHIQPISAVRIRLSRSEEGLRMGFDGGSATFGKRRRSRCWGRSSTATS